MIPDPLEIGALQAAFRAGSLAPEALVATLLDRIEAWPDKAVFITLRDRDALRAEAAAADVTQPLGGIPFVVKDNIDVAGLPTTAACPAFAYTPPADAAVVVRLRAAGAIVLGKANLDQFATGLNGTRSPYGAPRSVFDPAYISGGSSSGSAVAVGAGLAPFALGTDTAGSGRVPAAFNNLIGLKPTRGRISAAGVVPACRSLDCISVFANAAADAARILAIAEGADPADPFSRAPHDAALPEQPVIGVPAAAARQFAGDTAAAALYEAGIEAASRLGWTIRIVDLAPCLDAACLLYEDAFVAERLSAIRPFFAAHGASMDPVVREIIGSAQRYAAVDLFDAEVKLARYRQAAAVALAGIDALLLPTAPTTYTVEAMRAAPVALNAMLGTYTNFVNFFDMAAVALPAGFRADGLPFGVSLIARAFTDRALLRLADRLHRAIGAGAGRTRAIPRARMPADDDAGPEPARATIVVAGAHLSGMALNHELTAVGARLERSCRTAPDYRLYALATTPPKSGLTYAPGIGGAGIEVELWSLSMEGFGRFVAGLPRPMGIGKVVLEDGSIHPGFLCEAHALEGAEDITRFGGWRAYRAAS
jgi:allophanate hydrolase